ncbi:hypothetical protein ACOME3_007938 [Neoechinorhynchus agilis]
MHFNDPYIQRLGFYLLRPTVQNNDTDRMILEKIRASEKYHHGSLFNDVTYPIKRIRFGKLNERINVNSIVWKRPGEICSIPKLISHAGKVRIGDIDDIGVVGVMNACRKRGVQFLENRVLNKNSFDREYYGMFAFNLYFNGSWRICFIDDKLPWLKDSQRKSGYRPLGVRSEFENEFWPALLEKAMSKLLGGYSELSKITISEVFSLLVGGHSIEIFGAIEDAISIIKETEELSLIGITGNERDDAVVYEFTDYCGLKFCERIYACSCWEISGKASAKESWFVSFLRLWFSTIGAKSDSLQILKYNAMEQKNIFLLRELRKVFKKLILLCWTPNATLRIITKSLCEPVKFTEVMLKGSFDGLYRPMAIFSIIKRGITSLDDSNKVKIIVSLSQQRKRYCLRSTEKMYISLGPRFTCTSLDFYDFVRLASSKLCIEK